MFRWAVLRFLEIRTDGYDPRDDDDDDDVRVMVGLHRHLVEPAYPDEEGGPRFNPEACLLG
jgi:hypothetical protein